MVAGKSNIRNKRKQNDWFVLLTVAAILILLNYVASFVFFRVDLTAEKRYSLTDATKSVIADLEDIIVFKVYLEGEFPSGFKRLRSETIEMLNEFRAQKNGDKIEYEFINPGENLKEEDRNAIYKQLYEQGLRPTDLEIRDDDGVSKKIIWPGAIVSYNESHVALDLLQNKLGASPEEVLNGSIENLEYAISNSIQKLTNPNKPKIAFLEGHGELSDPETADIANSLTEYYTVERVLFDNKIDALTSRGEQFTQKRVVKNKYDVLVIAKPDSIFTEKDKFVIDQFLMYGGKILWLIDPVQADMDSLTKVETTMGIGQDLKLGDMLFTYGIRLNPNLVMDIQSAMIPLPVGMLGNQPRYELFPWFYFPLLIAGSEHPIVHNLNVVKGEFTSTIDTVGEDSIRKTILLTTSPYTKLVYSPVRISLGITKFEPEREQFNRSFQPVAYLLEGKFNSVFKGRLTSNFGMNEDVQFKEQSVETKMIVVADGDIIKNHVRQDNRIVPLGIDRFTGQEYGNKDFILNAVNYLCDEQELMAARSRSIKIRLLDKTKLEESRLNYQIFNVAVPILLVLAFGFGFNYVRRKKYGAS